MLNVATLSFKGETESVADVVIERAVTVAARTQLTGNLPPSATA